MRFTKLKIAVLLVFALLIVVFTLQNTEVVTVKLWFWVINTSRALLIAISIVVGAIFGMLLPSLRKFSSNKNEETEKEEEKEIEKK